MAAEGVTVELIGREPEARMIEDFLDRAASTPELLVLSGEAGIGKSALWQAGLDRARARGARVLAHRAVEAEAVLSFAGISDLLADAADEVLPTKNALVHLPGFAAGLDAVRPPTPWRTPSTA